MEQRNQAKANMLYDFIDASDFYHSPVAKDSRSMMNVAFTLSQPNLDSEFLLQAKKQGLIALKGHRDFGGIRASLYNAMPIEGVKALVDFYEEFCTLLFKYVFLHYKGYAFVSS